MTKELVFHRDIINWCVWENTDLADAVTHDAELCEYTEKDFKKHGFQSKMHFVILIPDHITEISVHYAIKHDKKLSDSFKMQIEYWIDDEINYVVSFFENEKRIRYLGYRYWIDLFNKDKPWEDYQNRGFELFSNQPNKLLAKVIAYNSYTKHNQVLKLWHQPRINSYEFVEDREDPGLKLYFDDKSPQIALEHALTNLKVRTCLTPITVTKYFPEKESN